MLVFRRIRPTAVTRGSCVILKTGPLCSLYGSRSGFSASAFTLIVRNFRNVNGLPPRPARGLPEQDGPRGREL